MPVLLARTDTDPCCLNPSGASSARLRPSRSPPTEAARPESDAVLLPPPVVAAREGGGAEPTCCCCCWERPGEGGCCCGGKGSGAEARGEGGAAVVTTAAAAATVVAAMVVAAAPRVVPGLGGGRMGPPVEEVEVARGLLLVRLCPAPVEAFIIIIMPPLLLMLLLLPLALGCRDKPRERLRPLAERKVSIRWSEDGLRFTTRTTAPLFTVWSDDESSSPSLLLPLASLSESEKQLCTDPPRPPAPLVEAKVEGGDGRRSTIDPVRC